MKKEQEKKEIQLSLKKVAVGFLFFWGLSIFGTWFLTKELGSHNDNAFPLLNERLKYEEYASLEERNALLFSNLIPLKNDLLNNYDAEKKNIAFYAEDLNSGTWTGWQEREPFISASLLKVPIAIGVMKRLDKGDWTLETSFKLEDSMKDPGFGDLWKEEAGSSFTVERLLSEMLQNSDNTAFKIFVSNMTDDDFPNIYYHIGITDPLLSQETLLTGEKVVKLSSKDMASVFRALYNATYLTRKSSNYILDLLTKTKFDENVPTDVPKDISVAHKIANFDDPNPDRPKNYHDCGIVYVPSHPYLFCVMTNSYDAKKSQGIITGIGGKVFSFFKNGTMK